MVVSANRLNSKSWSTLHEDMTSENDEIISLSKSMLDASSPNDDMWRKFSLPLTPPNSPPRSYGESSDSEDNTTDDITERLQDVCDSLDSTFDLTRYNISRLASALSLRSKLISDCMWSGNHTDDVKMRSNAVARCHKKLLIQMEEDLYPTPCPSPPPSVTEHCPSSSECVDPTTVFPFPLSNDPNSSQSDTDEEIDVVTVDTKPLTIVGIKRKHSSSNSSPATKLQTTPVLRRTKSSPPDMQDDQNVSQKVLLTDDSDPDTRRATHNVLERKRRIDLKKSFERLRDCVPNLEKLDKAPKVVVLKKAANHIEQLTREEQELADQKRLLQQEKQELVIRLNHLLNGRDFVF